MEIQRRLSILSPGAVSCRPSRSRLRKAVAALMPMAIGLGVLAGPAPPAEAATAGSVSVSSTGLLKFTAGAGAINDLTVSRQTLAGVTAIVLQDNGAPTRPAPTASRRTATRWPAWSRR